MEDDLLDQFAHELSDMLGVEATEELEESCELLTKKFEHAWEINLGIALLFLSANSDDISEIIIRSNFSSFFTGMAVLRAHLIEKGIDVDKFLTEP